MALIDIDRRTIAAMEGEPGRAVIHYDRRLTGFGVRISPQGLISYFVEFRPGAGGRRVPKRRIVLGRDAPHFRADHARAMAEQHLAKVRLGGDPAAERQARRNAPTVNEVVQGYIEGRVARLRKPTTHTLYAGYLRIHIDPQIGSRPAHLLSRRDITDLHRTIGRKHPVTANRVVVMLRAALEYGKRQGQLPAQFENPATAADAYREHLRERYLTEEEFARLGQTLVLAGSAGIPWTPDPSKKLKHAPRAENRRVVVDPYAIAAIKLLILTGARLREILNLRWDQVNERQGLAVLPDSKTGRKVLILSDAALAVLASIKPSGPFVIAGEPGTSGEAERPRTDLNRPWRRIRAHAGLHDLRIHDLRHSFASVGASSGLGLYVVGQLLGHRSASTTTRYAHVADQSLSRASNAIAGAIATALGLEGPSGK